MVDAFPFSFLSTRGTGQALGSVSTAICAINNGAVSLEDRETVGIGGEDVAISVRLAVSSTFVAGIQ